jgi:hypothetical protein
MATKKNCVACAEPILTNAKLCKHCGTLQDDPRFAHEDQSGSSPSESTSSSWQFLSKAEQDRRVQIANYVTGSGQAFFYSYDGYGYLFTIGKIDAPTAQIGRMESIGATWSEGADLARSVSERSGAIRESKREHSPNEPRAQLVSATRNPRETIKRPGHQCTNWGCG